jgi:hypothetical protein
MPQPVYIICSELISQDKETNQLSIFSIVESLEAHRGQTQRKQGHNVVGKSRIVAVWMKDDGDEEVQFEEEIVFLLPPNDKEVVAAKGTFHFESGKYLHRSIINMLGWPPIKGSGVMWVQSRIRRKDDEQWKTQSYPIVVDFQEHPQEANDVDTEAARSDNS